MYEEQQIKHRTVIKRDLVLAATETAISLCLSDPAGRDSLIRETI
jgi:hypothetical protein